MHGWHLHNGCHGEGAWGCLVGLRSDVLHGEGVRWENVTTDRRREMPSKLQGLAIQAAGTHSESGLMPARMEVAAREPIYLSVPISHKTFICH